MDVSDDNWYDESGTTNAPITTLRPALNGWYLQYRNCCSTLPAYICNKTSFCRLVASPFSSPTPGQDARQNEFYDLHRQQDSRYYLSPTQHCLLPPRRIHDKPCIRSDMCSAGSGYSCLATDAASKLRHETFPHQATLPAHLQCRRGASPGGGVTQMERSPSVALSKAYAQPSKIPRLTQADSSAAPQPSGGTATLSTLNVLHCQTPSWLWMPPCSDPVVVNAGARQI